METSKNSSQQITGNLCAWSCWCTGPSESAHLPRCALQNNHDCDADVSAITTNIETTSQEMRQIASAVLMPTPKDA